MSRDYYSEDVLWKNEYNIIYIYLKVYICMGGMHITLFKCLFLKVFMTIDYYSEDVLWKNEYNSIEMYLVVYIFLEE
jgi:hypothetical protein